MRGDKDAHSKQLPVHPAGPAEHAEQPTGFDRRLFLKRAGAGLALLAGSGLFAACSEEEREAFFQRHFKELSREDLAEVLARLSRQYSRTYDQKVTVRATPPAEDVRFGYGLDIARCVGCRHCVYACVEENNLSRDPQVHWIQVLEMDKDKGVDLRHANLYYNPERVPREGKFYFPVQCQQCSSPPCTKTCPVQATWKDEDGIVVVDTNWCIGCRCCMAACPYGARHFTWGEPTMPAAEVNPNMEYLGNRPQPKGVVSKCTFCLQRSRHGKYPACVEACPVGARKFGNLLDPQSEIRQVMRTKRVFIFKEELGTHPNFYYFYA